MTRPVQVVWKLIASWHETTHIEKVMSLGENDNRENDNWEVVTNTEKQSGDAFLCWAADTTLLDILTDECGCPTELFSNILNTYHRFEQTRIMYTHPSSFINAAKLYFDGLSDQVYMWLVCKGNPPFEGRYTGMNTIVKTLDTAEQV